MVGGESRGAAVAQGLDGQQIRGGRQRRTGEQVGVEVGGGAEGVDEHAGGLRGVEAVIGEGEADLRVEVLDLHRLFLDRAGHG